MPEHLGIRVILHVNYILLKFFLFYSPQAQPSHLNGLHSDFKPDSALSFSKVKKKIRMINHQFWNVPGVEGVHIGSTESILRGENLP